MKHKFTCAYCKSDEVLKDAWASWDQDQQDWVLANVFDRAYCNSCEDETSLVMEEISP